MPNHQARISGGRHHTHAADRQVIGQPSSPRRSRRAVVQRTRRSARSVSSISTKGNDHLLLRRVCQLHFAVRGHALFMWGGLGRTSEPAFSGELWPIDLKMAYCTAWHSVTRIIEPKCPRYADPGVFGFRNTDSSMSMLLLDCSERASLACSLRIGSESVIRTPCEPV